MGDQEFELRGILAMLKRQARVMFITFVIVLGLSALVIFLLVPAFTASTLILVERGNTDLLSSSTPLGNAPTDNAQVESEVQIASSEPIVGSVIDKAQLLADPEFTDNSTPIDGITNFLRITSPTPPTKDVARKIALGKLYNALKIERSGVTNLFTVTATANDPQTAAKIANTLADSYVQQQVESKISSKLAARDIIKSRITAANEEVIASEEAIDKYIADSISNIAEATGRTDLMELRNELQDANSNRARLSATIDLADKDMSAGDWQSLAKIVQSDEFNSLQQNYYDLQQQAAQAAPGSSALSDLQQQIANLSTQLRQLASSHIADLRTQVSDAQGLAADLKIQLRSSSLAADLPPAILTKLYELQQNAEFARNQYQTLLSRLNQLEAEAYLQVANSRIVSRATPPDIPSFPNTKLFLVLAGVGALGIAVLMAVAVENFVGGIVSAGQLGSLLHTNVVTVVPRTPLKKATPEGEPLFGHADLLWAEPFSMFAESIRRMQIGIDQALRRTRSRHRSGEQGSVVMVTSANANEGKTTIALALARAYALSGRNTLLIDCDLRKPAVHLQLGVAPSAGLSKYLSDRGSGIELRHILLRDERSEAEIVLGAEPGSIPTDKLVSSGELIELIQAARTTFDVTILDTSPIGPVVDALYLAQHADVIVLATSWANTSQSEARSAVTALSEAKQPHAEILSVLNQQSVVKRHVKRIYAGYYSS